VIRVAHAFGKLPHELLSLSIFEIEAMLAFLNISEERARRNA
jgi:hypothetical protein|tara:strand:- start:5555 stop:5680 length:126 start_codon:yes stop_codon:yes gene_type:complete